MIIDVLNMYNYQVILNNSMSIGMVHSYAPKLLAKKYKKTIFSVNRKMGRSIIIKAQLVDED